MLQKTIMLILLFNNGLIYPQTEITLRGATSNKGVSNDSINFYSGFVSKLYYETNTLTSEVLNNKFNTKFRLSYPQMYAVLLNSEKVKGASINDFVFLDNTTTEISFDANNKLQASNGMSNNEYIKIFTPHMINNKKENLNYYLFDNHELDINLKSYIEKYPNSYVALWYLIQKVSISGYRKLYEKSLNSFSDKIKSENLWRKVRLEFNNIRIVENKKFPKLDLKNVNLNKEKLKLPKAKYTLIDYWFSRCKPCLDQLPSLIEIYNKNKNKGFNVIGISVDKTENVITFWQKIITEKGIPWKNYLDENGTIATEEKIISFPSNFLLNEKGEIIKKNLTLEELEKILDEKL